MPRALSVLLVDRPGWPRQLLENELHGAGLTVRSVEPGTDLSAAFADGSADCLLVAGAGDCTDDDFPLRLPRVFALRRDDGETWRYELRLSATERLGPLDAAGLALVMAGMEAG